MTKYYVGYKQDDTNYVYVSSIENINVRVTPVVESAISFDNMELANGLVNIVNNMIANQDYVVLEITTDIKEVK